MDSDYIKNPGVKIKTAKLAKKLLKEGCRIIDIKPMKDNPDRTMFIFESTEKVTEYLTLARNKKAI